LQSVMRILFRSDRHDAKLGSVPATHCADLLTAGENHRCCNVRSCPKKCDKPLYYLTTDRGAPCAFYPALKRSTCCASSVVRCSSTNCDKAKIGKSIPRADLVLFLCRRNAGSLVNGTRSWAIEANSSFAGDLQFGNRVARSDLSQRDVRLSGIVDSGQ